MVVVSVEELKPLQNIQMIEAFLPKIWREKLPGSSTWAMIFGQQGRVRNFANVSDMKWQPVAAF